jgi:hypothetical protein
MATNLKEFDSLGGFSIDQTSVIDKDRNAKDLNTLEIKNSFYSDSKIKHYILRGLNTATLQLDDVGTTIPLDNSTVNFITGNFLAVNEGGVVYSGKIESSVTCNSIGAVSVLSSMLTIIKHDVPVGESWDIDTFSATNRFSYSVVRTGTIQTIKWVVSTQVVSIAWS